MPLNGLNEELAFLSPIKGGGFPVLNFLVKRGRYFTLNTGPVLVVASTLLHEILATRQFSDFAKSLFSDTLIKRFFDFKISL